MWNGLPNTTGPPANSSPVAADGSFRIDNVRNSEYLIAVNGIPSGLYLKRAVIGGQDMLAAPFLFSANAGGNLEVVLGTNPARLQGRVVEAQGRPAVAAQVVLVPVQRLRNDRYKATSTDLNGSFTISGIAPGEYRLFSWDAIEPFSYFDPDFIKVYESQAQLIHLDEGSAPTADFKIMPLVD